MQLKTVIIIDKIQKREKKEVIIVLTEIDPNNNSRR